MTLNETQKKVAKFYKEKFGNQEWTTQDRLLSLISQCSSLGERVQFEQGKRKKDTQHVVTKQLVGAIMLDALVLADQLDVDLEKEIAKGLNNLKMCKR
jgi:hypothetical protein